MLLHAQSSSVEVTDGFQSSSFTIVDSQNSFALLQGKQYENPVTATVRALVENALDAHTDAKSSSPIKISVEPEHFAVQDEGLGISLNTFRENFTKFFASNRTHSNEYHGFFGVGSKAPLSVAKQFSVYTVHEGIAYSWLCERGVEAPKATLLSSTPAADGQLGTKVEISMANMDQSFASYRNWMEASAAVANIIPDKVIVNNGSSAEHYNAGKRASLLIGGMPYPLPDKNLLNLPEEVYSPLKMLYYVEDTIAHPARLGTQFGKKNSAGKKIQSRQVEKIKTLNVPFSIGEVELHFSKERVASTTGNINKIRERTLQEWCKMQLDFAIECNASEHAHKLPWRMSIFAAEELRKQGTPTALLAWATRPRYTEGPSRLLEPFKSTLTPVQLVKEIGDGSKNKWYASVQSSQQIAELRKWATDWNVSLDLMRKVSSDGYNAISAEQHSLHADRFPQYDQRIESFSSKKGVPIVVLCMDDEWFKTDARTRGSLFNWWKANSKGTLVCTSLSMEDVHKHIPSAVAFKANCAKRMQKIIASFPDDALGLKRCIFITNSHHEKKWVRQWWGDLELQKVKVHNPAEVIAETLSVHAWLDIAPIEYVDLNHWVDEQEKKMPLLKSLADLTDDQAQHIVKLLNHP